MAHQLIMDQIQCGNTTITLQSIVNKQKVVFVRELVIALCFFYCSAASAAIISTEQAQELSQSKVWQLLLHSNGKKSFITDDRFFLHSGTFDPAQELMADINAFSQPSPLNDAHPICKFPARFQWVLHSFHLNAKIFPNPECSSYNEFLLKVPVNEVQLVFASENILSPSSMMGHVFLKLYGTDGSQRSTEHAVTYFTIMDSINVPKIIYQNLFGGMHGLFALQPYQQIKSHYLKKENRNIWEYSLKLTTEQKNFIRAHIWELKNMDSNYLFGDYNCATITYLLLAMVFPEKLKTTPKWLSPLDIVKAVHKHNLVESTQVVTSNYWKIHMLKDQAGSAFNPNVISNLSHESISPFLLSLSPIEKLYTQTYIHYLYDHSAKIPQKHKLIYDKIDTLLSQETQHYIIDYSNYKNPIKTPGGQHLQVSYGAYNHKNYTGLAFLPAAIRLTDDQRQYFSTRELRMFEVSARVFTDGKVKLDELTLYAVKSLNPWNNITKSFSGQWRLNAENHSDEILNQHLVLNASAGLGYTLPISSDFTLSGLYNVGIASNFKETYLYHFPEITVQVNEIWDMRTTVTFSMNFHMYNSSSRNDVLQLCQSYFYKQDSTFLACGSRTKNRSLYRDEFQLSFEKNF